MKLNRSSPIPLAAQVATHFRRLIDAGQLRPGDNLPPAGSVAGAGRVTVLEAYRLLAREGVVVSSPSRGTRVVGPARQTHYGVLLHHWALNRSSFANQVVATVIEQALLDGRSPAVYYLNQQHFTSVDDVESHVPGQLRLDMAQNLVRGLIVPHGLAHPPVIEWIRQRRLAAVFMDETHIPGVASVSLDLERAVLDGVRHLLALGYRRIVADLPMGEADGRQLLATLGAEFGATLGDAGWECEIHRHAPDPVTGRRPREPIVRGRELARDLLARPQLPDAVFLLDDVVGLGVVDGLHAGGVVLGRDITLQIAMHDNQLVPFFDGAIRWIVSCTDLARAAVALVEELRGQPAAPLVRKLPFVLAGDPAR